MSSELSWQQRRSLKSEGYIGGDIMATEIGAKVLIIEDEFILRQSMLVYLEDNGFVVLESSDGKPGLELFQQHKPDLVITDLRMPEVSGLDVLAKITKESPETPVLVISGVGGMEEVIEALRLGAWDYLPKPIIDLAVLKHAINKALERKRLLEENKKYAETLANNLHVLEEDQEAGRTVQMSLLPANDLQFGDYTLSHSVSPSLYLSGDFVEYFYITETKVGFYLADVSGHGASSAFVTVLLKSLISNCHARYQVHGDKTIFNPEHIMEELSYEIHTAKLGKYMTMIYGVIDLETNQLKYGVGGHYPNPILLGSDGSMRYLEGSGFPVGIMSSASYKAYTTEIPAGGALVLFSDGVMEVFMAGQAMEVKDKNLLELVAKFNADIPRIKQEIGIANKMEHQPDDITMLVVKRKSPL